MELFRVIYDEYGRTGNRFLSYLDSVGWAIVHNKKVIILFPEEEMKYYDNFRNSKYISLPLWGKPKIVWRICRKIFYYNRLIQLFYKTRLSRAMGFYAGWDLRDSMQYFPHAYDKIVELFTPNKSITEDVDRIFKNERQEGRTLVGVHIRRGDYRTYLGGASFYEDGVYLRFMQQIEELFPNVAFYLSSDEPLSDDYKKYHITEKNGNSAAYDMYALSKCDYIIGPGSTFSGWASFIGKNKLHYIKSKDEVLTRASFVTDLRESLCR